MYRKPGSQSALSGVLSGPYTGGRRIIDVGRLNAATRERVAAAVSGQSESTPIAQKRVGYALAGRGLLAIATAIIVALFVFQIGFHDRGSTWAYQPRVALAVYVIAGGLLALGALDLLRMRALAGRGAIPPGSYLLALDIVDVSKPDAKGAQRIELTPLGDARDAKITTNEGSTELVLSFADVTSRSFPLRGQGTIESTLRRLELTQKLLEELTYVSELGKAFAQDPFFDLRVDGSWSDVAPGKTDEEAPTLLLFRPAAKAGAAIAAVLFALGVFSARNAANDAWLFERALTEATPEAIDEYLARGGRLVERATVARETLVLQREAIARAAEKAKKETEDRIDFMNGIAKAAQGSRSACAEAIASRANGAHPEVTRALTKILSSADAGERDAVVPLRFARTVKGKPVALAGLDEHLMSRELGLARTFERVFSEVCAGNVLRFVYDAVDRGTAIDVAYEVSWPPNDGLISSMTVVYDVTFHGAGESAAFRLTMPPPKEPIADVRSQSIFSIPRTTKGEERILYATTARAFDRLYDELWSLFFAGQPRVPVAAPPAFPTP